MQSILLRSASKRTSYAVVSFVLLAVALVLPHSAHAQVSVTPNAGSATAVESTSGNIVTFTVTNESEDPTFFTFTCGRTGQVTSCTPGPASETIDPFESLNVNVNYATGSAGSGTITLTAQSSSSSDNGSFNVTVQSGGPPSNWDVTPFNNSNQRCADSCSGLQLTVSTVPYFSLENPRNVTLVYDSERREPKPLVHLNVKKPSGAGTVTQIQLQVKRSGVLQTFVNGENLLRFTPNGSGNTRIGGRLSTGTLTTGMYDIQIIVTFVHSGGSPIVQSWNTKLMVINENLSPVARGWTIAGAQRLFLQADGSALITQGDGSAIYFQKVGANWIAPAGEFSVLKTLGSGYRRLFPDSTDVRFNSAGRMTTVYDPDNNATNFTYDGSNRLTRITDPKGKAINLTYGTYGVATIYDSVAATSKRTTRFNVASNATLTRVIEPNNDTTVISYTGGLHPSTVTAPNGGVTTYQYHTNTGELWKTIAPAVPVYGEGTVAPTTIFVPWPRKVAPNAATATTPFTAPDTGAVWDSTTAPGGQVMRMRVNRFGDAVKIDVPLGADTDIKYSAAGLPVKVARTGGWGTDSLKYDSGNRLIWTRSAATSATPRQIRYGAFSQPDSIWGGSGEAQRRFINATNGRLDSLRIGGTSTYTAKIKYTYNVNGQVVRVVDQEGITVSRRGYDVMGNLKADTAPGNRVTTYGRDNWGRVTTVTPPVGAVQTTYYDIVNRVDSIRDGVNTKAIRNARGKVWSTVTDPKSQVYRDTVNLLGWQKSRVDPLAKADTYQYDRNGLLREWKNRRLGTTTFTYDNALRPLTAGSDTYSYDASTGRIVRASNTYATDSTYLNARGTPDSVKTHFPVLNKTYVIRYYYNNNGVLDSTKASGPSVSFLTRKYYYNQARGTLDSIKLSTETTKHGAAPDLALNQITLPGAITVNVNRTSSNAISQHNTTAGYGSTTNRQAGYDKGNRVKTQMQLAASSGHRYGYDGLGRLVVDSTVTATSAQCPPLPDDGFLCSSWTYQGHLSYTYDAASNRTDAGATYLAGSNQIRNFASCSYLTDADGNITSQTCPGGTATYQWDSRNRLTTYTSNKTWNLRYDAAGRLVRVDTSGTALKYFLWDGDDLIAELNAAGAIVLEYSYYPGMDNLHAVKKGGASTIYYAHYDLQGNVVALTAGSTVHRTYQYSAWGAGIGGTDPGGFNNTDRARWKGALLFTEFDLYYMRARWYHPVQGRFLSEDPIGLAGGINPYVFAGDDPINGRDPTGLECWFEPLEVGEKLVCEDLSSSDWRTIGDYLNESAPGTGDWAYTWAGTLGAGIRGGKPAPIYAAKRDSSWVGCPIALLFTDKDPLTGREGTWLAARRPDIVDKVPWPGPKVPIPGGVGVYDAVWFALHDAKDSAVGGGGVACAVGYGIFIAWPTKLNP